MATIIKRRNIFHIQWYDPLSKKITSKSTGLEVSANNYKKVELYANKLQQELTKRNNELKKIGIKSVRIQDAFDHFLENNQYKHPKTIYDYHRFYKKFTDKFDPSLPTSIITKLSVERWLNEIKKLPLAKNSIHGYGKQCVHFLNFLFEYNYTPMFKINREVRTRPEIKEKIVFRDEDIIKIFDGFEGKNSNFITTIYLLFYTGLRSSDIITLTVDRIDFNERKFSYYSTKRKKFREVAFHKDLIPILKSRVSELKEGRILDYHNETNLGRAVKRFFHAIKIDDRPYSAKTFRKTFITLARSKYNMDFSIVRELVGHEHGNTTDRYYNQITITNMKNELNKFKRPTSKK
jgi:integrase